MNFDTTDIKEFKKIIESIVDAKIASKRFPTYVSAVVVEVDSKGLVTVFIPPETELKVTGLLNKTGETLAKGDSVEIATKNGMLSNAWVAIKHGTSNARSINTTTDITLLNKINELEKRIEKLESEK